MNASAGPSPSVSVVIPTYNGRAHLLEALQSVFDQTYGDYEVIVVDDGSTDDTAAAIDPLIRAGRARGIRQENAGTAAARRRGVENSQGEFIALLDHDDLWPVDKLEWQVRELRADPGALLVYGTMQSFGMERPYRWPPPDGPTGWVQAAFLRKNWIRSPGQTLIRASAIRQVGGFDPTVRGADDWDLYLKLAATGRFIYRDRLALNYRAHGNNQSKQPWLLFRHACRVHRRHAGPLPLPGTALRWLRCRVSLVNLLVSDLRARRRVDVARRQQRASLEGV